MKGIVFTEFLEMVEDVFSMEMSDHLLTETNPASGGAYTAVGTYDYKELVAMVVELSKKTDIAIPALLETYGKHLFTRFVALYPQFFEESKTAFEFLEGVHGYIHVEVLKLYPDAELPSFSADRSNGTLTMIYESPRSLADFGRGLMLGCIKHYGEDIEINQDDVSDGKGTRVQFTLNKK